MKTSGYIKDYYQSRNYDMDFDRGSIPCEFCQCRQIIEKKVGRHPVVQEIHHIEQSMRGKRKHSKDGSDLIGVCRKCHSWIHSNNTYETRMVLKIIVQNILEATQYAEEQSGDVSGYMRAKIKEISKKTCLHRKKQ